jgi:tetratricopeptide (TPR) repeat protein
VTGGYGSRIYVNKHRSKKPWVFLITILLIFFGWYLFKPSKKDYIPKRSSNISKQASPDQEVTKIQTDFNKRKEKIQEVMTNPEVDKQTIPEENQPSTNELVQANQYFLKRQYKDALTLYKKMADSDRNARLFAGLCHYWLEQYEEALLFLKKFIDEEPANFLALKYLALTNYKLDDIEGSLELAQRALAIKKDAELIQFYNKLLREKDVMTGYGATQKPNFTIIFSKFEHSEIKETVLDILKEAYRVVGLKIDFYPSNSITVILYNEKGFFDVTRAPGWAGGLYDGKIRIPIKGAEGREDLLKRIIFHEYTHALVHAMNPKTRTPVWLNEGLAEYFSLGEYETKVGQIIPLKVLELGFPSGNVKIIQMAYAESYSAVSYLIDKFGMYKIKELLQTLSEGKDLHAAFDSVLFFSYNKFLETWGK